MQKSLIDYDGKLTEDGHELKAEADKVLANLFEWWSGKLGYPPKQISKILFQQTIKRELDEVVGAKIQVD